MGSTYTIRIAASDSDDVLVAATVEVSADSARIVEVRAEVGPGGVVPHQLISIDFSLLVRTALMLSGTAGSGSVASLEHREEPERLLDSAARPVVEVAVAEEDEHRVVDQSKPVSRSSTERNGMPSDFGVNYWRLGSIAKVSAHYDVPRRIAQDWIRTLQQQGKVANPWPKRGMRSSQ